MMNNWYEREQDAMRIQQLESGLSAARDQLAEMREALEWLVNLHHGQSKGGDEYSPPSSMEWRAAIDAGKEALSADPAGGRVLLRAMGKIRHVHNKPDEPHTYIEYDGILDPAYKECISAGKVLTAGTKVGVTVQAREETEDEDIRSD